MPLILAWQICPHDCFFLCVGVCTPAACVQPASQPYALSLRVWLCVRAVKLDGSCLL